jgi:hypothetical protein
VSAVIAFVTPPAPTPRGWRAPLAACLLLAAAAAGCRSVRGDEGLAMLDVSASAALPAFTSVRFSVAGRPEIMAREIAYDGQTPLRFGYYLPGPSGTVRVTGQALSASCPVGVGSAEVEVRLGRVSAPVPLVIDRAVDVDPICVVPSDGAAAAGDATATDAPGGDASYDVADARGGDATTTDARPDATGGDAPSPDARPDAIADARPADATTTTPPPACLAATKGCPGASPCCSGLVCGTTTLGQVCCGNFGMTCTRPGGEDCCGQLECVNGGCCLPATYACNGGSCCAGLVCSTTTLGRVCCGNSGAPCKRADGADCCGALRCVNNVCRT